jgi:SAM-dependent methyltransferase
MHDPGRSPSGDLQMAARVGWVGALERWLFPRGGYMGRYRFLAQYHASAGMYVLHLGGGWDRFGVAAPLSGARVLCVDLDRQAIRRHPGRWRVVGDGERLPLRSASCDLVLCEHVFEHFVRPARVVDDVARVLRPGGHLVFATPNRYGPVALLARVSPHALHAWWNRKRGAAAEDTFPTLYRLNTRSAIERECARAGLKRVSLDMIMEGAIYLRPIPPAYVAALVVCGVLARLGQTRGLWTSIVGCYRKEKAG